MKVITLLLVLVTAAFAQRGRPQQFGPYNLCPDTPTSDQLLQWNTAYNCWKPATISTATLDTPTGKSVLTTNGVVPKINTSGTLVESAIRDTGSAIRMTDRTLDADGGGSVPGWRKYTLTKLANDGNTCQGATVAAVFTGTGLDDATGDDSIYELDAVHTYTVIIDGAGTPDTFKWQKDAGTFTEGVAVTGTAQALADGIYVTFAATTGHTATDQWVITATPKGCWQVDNNAAVVAETDTSQDLQLRILNAKEFIEAVRVKTKTVCAGAATINLGLGTDGNNVFYRAANYNLKTAVSATNFSDTLASVGSTTTSGTAKLVANVVVTTDTVADIDAGCAVEIWTRYSILP